LTIADPKPTVGVEAASGRSKWFAALPLVVFLVLAAIFYKQLLSTEDKSTIPSALIGKQAPIFDLVQLEGLKADGKQLPGLSSKLFDGNITVVNVWASWCVPCRAEHPVISSMAKDPRIKLAGINYKDKTENALRFLGQLGNPFSYVGVDPKGKVAIDWGVYGIPETFLVGKDGKILYKHVGPMSDQILAQKFMPEIEKALKH